MIKNLRSLLQLRWISKSVSPPGQSCTVKNAMRELSKEMDGMTKVAEEHFIRASDAWKTPRMCGQLPDADLLESFAEILAADAVVRDKLEAENNHLRSRLMPTFYVEG